MGENNLEKKLTINDIAQMSGVAKSTVSRYLNGGSVKDATAQKIKKIIEENNYEPNLFARLNAKESRIIGLTVPGFNSVTTPRLVEVIVPCRETSRMDQERAGAEAESRYRRFHQRKHDRDNRRPERR